MVKARALKDRGVGNEYQASFNHVFQWIDGLRGSSYYVELDLDNLEHVFSLAEMMRQLNIEGSEQLVADLQHIIMITLDRCTVKYSRNSLLPDRIYKKFVDLIWDWHQKRRQSPREAGTNFETDAIITFNYDVMLDYAIHYTNAKAEYRLESDPHDPSVIPLLKLHGSSNWGLCQKCADHKLQVVDPLPIPPGHSLHHGIPEGHDVEFRMVTNTLKNNKCGHCHQTGTLVPFVIPPTWSKMVYETPVSAVWRSAVEEIRKAFQIVVVGYSLPQTDTFFQYLLTLGLTSNPNLNRVVVVNLDESAALRERYGKVFSRSLIDRGRLKFLGLTFEEFVSNNDYMKQVGQQVEWKDSK